MIPGIDPIQSSQLGPTTACFARVHERFASRADRHDAGGVFSSERPWKRTRDEGGVCTVCDVTDGVDRLRGRRRVRSFREGLTYR